MIKKCIMFADVAGSTAMYEKHGNAVAEQVISTALGKFTDIIQEHKGTVVKYIGDEVLCYFSEPSESVYAAIKIQELCDDGIPNAKVPIQVRIGMDYGGIIRSKDDDIFGDTVNTAARMVGYAKSGQIITNENVIEMLPDDLRSLSRKIDKTRVKGKAGFIGICRINWEQENDDVTRIATETDYVDAAGARISSQQELILYLKYMDKEYTYDGQDPDFLIGRDPSLDLVVVSSLASRRHAKIVVEREKYVYYDSSTNGTTIQLNGGGVFFLRRENMALYGSGLIRLGDTIEKDSEEDKKSDVIKFDLTSNAN